jgi:putative chitinase
MSFACFYGSKLDFYCPDPIFYTKDIPLFLRRPMSHESPRPGDILQRLSGMIPDRILSDLSDAVGFWAPTADPSNTTILALRLAHFLGQCAHESDGFKRTYENLNYSAQRLKTLFPKYFPDSSTAEKYAKSGKEIASRVYAERMGNGDEASGDGFRFRGRGYLQLTGRRNYTQFSSFIGYDCVLDPDAVAKKYPLVSGLFFFHDRQLWPLCDQGLCPKIIKQITLPINAGHLGLEKRIHYVQAFFEKMNPKSGA